MNTDTIYHLCGTVTVWDSYRQSWQRNCAYIEEDLSSTLNEEDREAIRLHVAARRVIVTLVPARGGDEYSPSLRRALEEMASDEAMHPRMAELAQALADSVRRHPQARVVAELLPDGWERVLERIVNPARAAMFGALLGE